MGDRYIIEINCAWCNHTNKNLIYNQEWATDFFCERCKKENDIEVNFVAKQVKEVKS